MKFSELVQKLGEAAACNSLTSNNDCDPEITEWQLEQATTGTQLHRGGKICCFVATTDASADFAGRKRAAQAQERGIAWIATPQTRLPKRSLCSTNPSAQHRKYIPPPLFIPRLS